MNFVQSVPLRVTVQLEEFFEDEETENWPLRELVGDFMWLAISTRPDISNAVRSVARYRYTPKYIHYCEVVLLYAENHPLESSAWYYRIHQGYLWFWHYKSEGDISRHFLEVFADADYASKTTDRRSVSGGANMCGSACVCWFSRKQKCVTLSMSETEYVALGDAVIELLFLTQFWRFTISYNGMPCFPVFEDNEGALQLSKNPVSNSNSKHIDVCHHFLREPYRQGDIISINHVPSEYQHVDILKILAFNLLAIHRRFFMNLSD